MASTFGAVKTDLAGSSETASRGLPDRKGSVRTTALAILTLGLTLLLPASGASAVAVSHKAFQAAQTTCFKGLASNAVVTEKMVTACNVVSVPTPTACSHGPSVFEVYVDGDVDAFIRVGYRPRAYAQQKLFKSEAVSLCGDPISPGMTPPAAPIAPVKVRALIHSLS